MDKTIPFTPTRSRKDLEKVVRTGKILTHFQLEKQLGEGGMGTVYLGKDITLDRSVAIKFLNHTVIRKSLSMNSSLSAKDRETAIEVIEARFKREAKSAASISHPNLAQIYEANFETDDWYIAMEYVTGDSLAGLIEKGQKFSIGQILTICKQTIAGLKHAWDHYKIIHRDIKPANIMVTPEGVVKIVDLGLAKPVGGQQEVSDLTVENMSMGTPQYMAPEQARDEDVNYHADIFSLGATLYELCANEKAFQGNTPAQVYHCQTKKTYVNIQELRPDTPRPLVRLIETMMEPDPSNRPADYDELLKSVDMIENDGSSSLNTLVGLVSKEVRRLQSVNYSRLIPWQPFAERRFWMNPMLHVLVIAGLLPVFLLKDSPEPGRMAWFVGIASIVLWGAIFQRFLQPDTHLQLTLLKAMGVTLVVGVLGVVILSRFNVAAELFSQDFLKRSRVSLWKLILITALVEEALKLLGVWFLPKLMKSAPTHVDYCITGIACGLVFSLKAAIVFSIISWDHSFVTWASSTTRLFLLLLVGPLLHACWTGISARFIYLARESKTLQIMPIVVGLSIVSLLHGLWLAFPRSHWSLLIGAVTVLLFLASIAREKVPSAE